MKASTGKKKDNAPALPKPRLALFDGVATVTSLTVADAFGKPHDNVLHIIARIRNGQDAAWCDIHCRPGHDHVGNPMFRLTREGFIWVVAAFPGRKAKIRNHYLAAFDAVTDVASATVPRQDTCPQPDAVPRRDTAASPAASPTGFSSIHLNVFAGMVQGRPSLLVDARELHFALETEHEFAPWMTERVDAYGYAAGQDYVPVLRGGIPAGDGQKPFTYFLSLEMAMELAIIEQGDRAKAVKRHLQRFDQRLQAIDSLGALISNNLPRSIHTGGKIAGIWDSEGGGFMELVKGKPVVKAAIRANTANPVVSRDQVVPATPANSTSSPPIFHFDGRTVRTAVEGDEVWFVAKDVFETLELAWKGSDSLAKIPDEWRVLRKFRTTLENQHGSQGTQEKDLLCLNFKAVCKVAFRSNKPEADRFTNWAAEVIDTIRKTGRYEVQKPAAAPVPSTNRLPGLNICEEEFFLAAYHALGRENGMATLLVQLVKMGALNNWIDASLRSVADASGGKISKTNIAYNTKRLKGEGLIDHEPSRFLVIVEAIRALLPELDKAGLLESPEMSGGKLTVH